MDPTMNDGPGAWRDPDVEARNASFRAAPDFASADAAQNARASDGMTADVWPTLTPTELERWAATGSLS